MPRRAPRKPDSTKPAAAAPTTTPPKHHNPTSNPPSSTPRASKRLKSSPPSKPTPPKKSKYFSHPPSSSSEAESEIANEESGYEDEDASASAVSSPPSSSNGEEDEDEDEYASDEAARPTKRKRAGAVPSGAKGAKGQELWRPGVKTGLGPGKQVYIALPKARGPGGVRYEPAKIHPNTMIFLGELKANNDREWLKVHDADYRQAKSDFDTFVESLTDKIIEKDDTIPELPPKDLTFRIYRDIRFSPDPTPYKTYFSAAWSRTGRKGPYAGYYLQLAPGNSFLGAGLWHPDAAPLALLRRAVDRRAHTLENVLLSPQLRKEFLGGVKAEGGKVVGKFIGQNAEGMLKTRPKGYEASNKQLPLLRLRNYTVGRKLRDEEVVGEGGWERVVGLVGVLVPFVQWLNGVVMPDEGEEGEEDEEGEDEEGEEGEEGEDDDGEE